MLFLVRVLQDALIIPGTMQLVAFATESAFIAFCHLSKRMSRLKMEVREKAYVNRLINYYS